MEDFGRLRKTQETPTERDLITAQPPGSPAAVPVFLDGTDGLRSRSREIKLVENFGTAIAARLDDPLSFPLQVLDRPKHAWNAPGRADPTRTFAQDVPDYLRRPRPVDEFCRSAKRDVIRVKHTRGL